MRDVYIVDAIRTPIGKFGSALAKYSAVELGSIVIKKVLERNPVDPNEIDAVIMGHVIRSGTGQSTARQASILAGVPKHVDAFNVDMVCASGMAAVIAGSSLIKSGSADVVIAGGMESMSRAPFIIPYEYRWGVRLLYGRVTPIIDALVYEGLTDPLNEKIMVQEADMVAIERGYDRRRLEEIALESHVRAHRATESGYFSKEIVPIVEGDKVVLDRDEGIRPDTSLEKMAKLPPVFPGGVHTAATSSQISDGASALLLASEDAVGKYGLRPRAKVISHSWYGTETWRFVEAPVYAVRKLLSKLSMSVDEVEVFENNEAFATSTAVFEDMLNVPRSKINLFGGAIALGHPIGASGARIITTLLNVMEHHNYKRGVASVCHGVGGAAAILIERV